MSIEIKLVLEFFVLGAACIGFIYNIRNATSVMTNKCEYLDKRLIVLEEHKNDCECLEKIGRCETCLSFLQKSIDEVKLKK